MSTPQPSMDAARTPVRSAGPEVWADAPPGAPAPGRAWSTYLMPVLAALAVLLLIATLTVFLLARRSIGAAEDRVRALQAERAQDARLAQAPPSVTPPKLDRGALQTQLAAVRTADAAIDTAAARWRRGGSELAIVWDSVGRCMYEVDRYDRAAGWFTKAQLGTLPTSIDLKAADTDCGTATLARYARGAGF